MADNRCTCYDDLPLMLTVAEVIDALGIGRNTLYEIIRMGELPSRRIGKRGQIRVLKDVSDAVPRDRAGDQHTD